jgi:glycosyltransferase involved in cell wall biosynthesis
MLQSYCARDSRIKVIDKTLTRSEVDMLMNECNVFLSMHRSEGFGLGPAEALASEKIVVSTDYGGTTDFINQSTGYPVEYKLVPLKPNDYWQWDKQIWADPSIDSAAIALRNIYDHYHDALIRAKNGRKFMKDHHSFEVIGRQMKDLL